MNTYLAVDIPLHLCLHYDLADPESPVDVAEQRSPLPALPVAIRLPCRSFMAALKLKSHFFSSLAHWTLSLRTHSDAFTLAFYASPRTGAQTQLLRKYALFYESIPVLHPKKCSLPNALSNFSLAFLKELAFSGDLVCTLAVCPSFKDAHLVAVKGNNGGKVHIQITDIGHNSNSSENYHGASSDVEFVDIGFPSKELHIFTKIASLFNQYCLASSYSSNSNFLNCLISTTERQAIFKQSQWDGASGLSVECVVALAT